MTLPTEKAKELEELLARTAFLQNELKKIFVSRAADTKVIALTRETIKLHERSEELIDEVCSSYAENVDSYQKGLSSSLDRARACIQDSTQGSVSLDRIQSIYLTLEIDTMVLRRLLNGQIVLGDGANMIDLNGEYEEPINNEVQQRQPPEWICLRVAPFPLGRDFPGIEEHIKNIVKEAEFRPSIVNELEAFIQDYRKANLAYGFTGTHVFFMPSPENKHYQIGFAVNVEDERVLLVRRKYVGLVRNWLGASGKTFSEIDPPVKSK